MNQLDQDEKLIIEVQQYPGLYDQGSVDYRDLRKKETMWQAVAESLKLHARECQARWRVLRDKFVREMRKNMNPKRAGGGALQVYQGSWPLMSQLMFLTSHVKHRPYRTERRDTFSEAGGTEDEEDLEQSEEDEVETKYHPNKLHHQSTNNSSSTTTTTNGSLQHSTFSRPNSPASNLKRPKITHSQWDTFLSDVEQPIRAAGSLSNTLRHDEEENGERLFCLSLVSALKRLEPEKRSVAKMQIQKLLHNLEFPQVKVEL